MKVNEPLVVKRYHVALSPVRGSENHVKVTRTGALVAVPVVGVTEAVGLVVSIQSTVAIVSPVVPSRLAKVKVNDQLVVKRCPVALSPVNGSEKPVKVTRTGIFVQFPVRGKTVACGLLLCTRFTVAMVSQVFPARSE